MTSVTFNMQPPHWGRAPQALNTAPGVTMQWGSQALKRSVADLSCEQEMTLHWQMITAGRSCGKAQGCSGTQRQQHRKGNIETKLQMQALLGKHDPPINYPTNLLGYKSGGSEVNPRLNQAVMPNCRGKGSRRIWAALFGPPFQPC